MFDLRPHQQTVIDTLQENRKGQIIVPTGGGKTMCMIKDAQRQFNSCDLCTKYGILYFLSDRPVWL